MAFEKEDMPTTLRVAYIGEKCGIFVGAGLSRAAGLPDWSGLLRALVDKAKADHSITASKAAECYELAKDSSKYLILAEEMREVMGAEFNTSIEELFERDEITPTQSHDLLISLKKNKFIITTNYDMLIEKSFAKDGKLMTAYKYYEANSVQRSLYKREFFLLKAHGDAKTSAERIVLTGKDYRNLLHKQLGYQSALQSIFTMYSVIFVGSSLRDPELNLLLNYITSAFPEGGIPHYALMPMDEVGNTEKDRWRKDYNIQIIPISSENNFEDIRRFFEYLVELDGEPAT